MARLIQPAFSRGEIAPDLFGRVDTQLYQLALKRARNTFIHPYGGVSNRPGLEFIGPVKDHTRVPRLIPFEFTSTDTHIIEFGHLYIRIIRDDAHVVESAFTVIDATQTDPIVIQTSAAHGFSSGDEVFLADIGGMVEIANTSFLITALAADTFSLQNQVTGVDIDGTGFTAFTSGGTAARVFTITTPYLDSELREIKYLQAADVMTLVHTNHEPRELRRFALDNWTLTVIAFKPTQLSPSNVVVTPVVVGTETAKYKVTSTAEDGEQSLSGLSAAATHTITNITQANPAVVTTSAANNLDNGDEIEITGVVGMTEVNDRRFRVNFLTATTFQLRNINSTGFTAYTSGGSVTEAFAKIATSTEDFENNITWNVVAGAISYSVFREENGIYGLIGETEALTFEDDSTKLTADLTETPPQERNPFFGSNNFPGAVGGHEQRRVFGGSNNKPDTSFYSRIGETNNFSVAIPARADDAITATLPATEVNQIRHFTSIGELLLFTSGAEWLVQGGVDVGFTLASISQKFQTNWGSSQLKPIVVGATVLFVIDPGVAVRAIGFVADIDGFKSASLSLLIPHLLRNRSMVEWDYARTPDSLAYAIRDDGEVLVLTFEEEQQVIAWATWDTAGKFESVAVVRPSPAELTDAGYFVIKRTLNGVTTRTIERTHDRQFEDVRDGFFVDSGLTFDNPLNIEDIDEANPVKITITGHGLSNLDEVDIADIIWVPDVDADFNETQPDQLNDGRFEVANVTANDFTLKSIDTGDDVDGSAFNLYVEGGTVRLTAQTFTGLQHLANEKVVALADGNVVKALTVNATGGLTFTRKFSRVHIGLPYISDVETLSLETATGGDTIQGVLKKVTRTTVRFNRSRGLLIGPTSDELVEIKQREFERLAEPTKLKDGDVEVYLTPDWNVEGRIFMRQKDPLPMTILAVIPEVEFGDT